ncbi:hypothetical protein H257_12660 [Aphanomyces astaci]|uniref:CCHC-type domain-containing protein n=1 Tax=Aphanomyces astaci TaxID=112090 RepID=W4FZI4_APHAT|nr:hypothetical protein H257_12660 [Aphanomyces astaci]ETV72184.1 hypothetical protein H257_12660 [Aphanomyces astaci]|eukprot:XP_009838252.1 hypothetical protein H257_12660 [Aphanomyces astaci]
MSAKMAEITQNSIRKAKETVREYAWRINDAAQDLELRRTQAVQIFIDGCKDPGVASCIRGSETRPGTIQECLDYLRFRDMDLDMRLNDANGHDVPRSTSSATRVNRTNSTDATSKSTEEAMAALRADVASMMQNQLASLTNAVANIAPRRPSGNQPVVPNIRMDPDETTTQLGRVVCGRCQRSGYGREACPYTKMKCSRCNTVGHANWECSVPFQPRALAGDHRCYNCNELGHLRVECPSFVCRHEKGPRLLRRKMVDMGGTTFRLKEVSRASSYLPIKHL